MRRIKKTGEREEIAVFGFIVSVIAISILLASSAKAEIAVVDFESLATPGTGYSTVGITYIEDGFTVQAKGGYLYHWNSDDVNFPGSTALFNATLTAIPNTQITRDDGRVFDLESIMLSELTINSGYTALTLNGTRNDNSKVSASIGLDGTFGFETFSFGEFTSLKELRLDYDGYLFQYDNIAFNVVPEPGTLFLLSFGVFILPKRK